MPYYEDDTITLHHGDATDVAATLEPGSIDCIVTSPPYFGLRDYGSEGQYGLEETPKHFVDTLVGLFEETKRALADDGTLWVNLGDSYGRGSRPMAQPPQSVERRRNMGATNIRPQDKRSLKLRNKSLIGIPWMFALAMKEAGWILRNEIIWAKPNGMPAKVQDRFHNKHEHIFLFTKNEKYFFDLPDSARGDVWNIATVPFKGAHFAVFPPEMVARCIDAGCKPGGTVMDPFSGSGTTGMVAQQRGMKYVGIDISADYLDLSLNTRLRNVTLDLGGVG
jgi:site-specific DNA-methyltransferase (cytosine-N4-specific)